MQQLLETCIWIADMNPISNKIISGIDEYKINDVYPSSDIIIQSATLYSTPQLSERENLMIIMYEHIENLPIN